MEGTTQRVSAWEDAWEKKKLRAMPHNSSSLLLIWGGLEGSRRQASGPDYGRLFWLCYMKYKDPFSVVGPLPCSGILDCTKRRKWTKCHHLLFPPWLQLNTTSCFKTPWLPLHGGWHLKLWVKISPLFAKELLSEDYITTTEKWQKNHLLVWNSIEVFKRQRRCHMQPYERGRK